MNELSKNADEYTGGFPKEIQTILRKIRVAIKKTVPEAEENISS